MRVVAHNLCVSSPITCVRGGVARPPLGPPDSSSSQHRRTLGKSSLARMLWCRVDAELGLVPPPPTHPYRAALDRAPPGERTVNFPRERTVNFCRCSFLPRRTCLHTTPRGERVYVSAEQCARSISLSRFLSRSRSRSFSVSRSRSRYLALPNSRDSLQVSAQNPPGWDAAESETF